MKLCALLFAIACMCCCGFMCVVYGVPVACSPNLKPGSCQDPPTVAAAGLALSLINQDLNDGYVLSLHRLYNVDLQLQGHIGVVYYLTIDVEETKCHVLSRKDWSTCQTRPTENTPVYGQCKAAIFISTDNRLVRLYKYGCVIRPAPAIKVASVCPDCPSYIALDSPEVLKTITLSLKKFNKDSTLANRFAILNITRATSQMGMAVFYNVEYTIQETTCANTSTADVCPLMECKFAHKGFCKATHSFSHGVEHVSVECEIYEPEAAEREQQLHLLGGEIDHSHKPHDTTRKTADAQEHDHPRGHTHGHDHGQGHDHVHGHHAKAHDHGGDTPHQHHGYHAADVHTHEHDHEHALDHQHQHAHLHDHEHHHHHHTHEASATAHRPEGTLRVLPAMDQPVTLPAFPHQPTAAPDTGMVSLLLPECHGQREPIILPFPRAISGQCPAPPRPEPGSSLVVQLFAEDPMFRSGA